MIAELDSYNNANWNEGLPQELAKQEGIPFRYVANPIIGDWAGERPEDMENVQKQRLKGLNSIGNVLGAVGDFAASFVWPNVILETVTGKRGTSTTGEKVGVVERAANVAGAGLGVGIAAKGGKLAGKVDDVIEAAGQLRHPISAKIFERLAENKNISQTFKDNYRKFVTQALDKGAHNGYQQWHRELDKKIVDWLADRPKVPESEFIEQLKKWYGTPDIAKKFPNFAKDFDKWLNTLSTPKAVKVKK